MNLVYCKISLCLIDDTTNFFRKLKRYVGDFRIEAQSVNDVYVGIMTVSFFTNVVKIKEGEDGQVYIEAKRNERGSWYFTNIEKA